MSNKYSPKAMRILIITCVIIGLVATAVGIVALALKQYVIAAAMFIVAGWQVLKFINWKKRCR